MVDRAHVETTVNGTVYARDVDPRMTLADFLRDELRLTGTHIGCEHGACGSCTVLLNGESVRSCIIYAPQANGSEIMTIEGLNGPQGSDQMHPIQEAMKDCHGLQCGFCTPGMVLTIFEMLSTSKGCTDAEIEEAISGNICRCTGYQPIISAARQADANWVRTVEGGSEERP